MGTESITIREKQTSPIDMQLLADGSGIDLTTVSYVRLDMVDGTNKTYRYTTVDSSAYVAIVTAATGSVRFTPPDENIFRYQNGDYKLYWKVFTSSSQQYSVPETTEDEVVIKLTREY